MGAAVFGLWASLLAIVVMGAVQPPPNGTRYPAGSLFAGLDNFALPLAVIFTTCLLLSAGGDRDLLLRITCRVTVWALCGNAILAIIQFAGYELDLSAFYNGDGSESVSSRASTLGRYGGLINQPAEAGLLYSVALLATLYLYRERLGVLAATATIVGIGGVLTVSKVFLLVGAPIGLWQLTTAKGGRHRRLVMIGGLALLVAGIVRSGLLPSWSGQHFLLRLLPGSGQDTVALYSAGRFGEASPLATVADAVLQNAPMFGFGAAGLAVPYDNAWLEVLVTSGVLGAAIYTAILVLLVAAWYLQRPVTSAERSRLAGGVVAIVVFASGGVPALTANRCATLVWLLLALLMFNAKPRYGTTSVPTFQYQQMAVP